MFRNIFTLKRRRDGHAGSKINAHLETNPHTFAKQNIEDVTNYAIQIVRDGYSKETIKTRIRGLKHLAQFVDLRDENSVTDQFTCKTATTPEEAIKLVEVGFEFVQEINGTSIYKKRK